VPGHARTHDDEIAQRAVNLLAWSSTAPRDAIKVKVSDGWVTLSGKVDWNYQRESAERTVRGLSGITGVSNAIELAPAASVVDVKRTIVDALQRRADIEAKRIRVEVRDSGTVRLEGEVDSWDERNAVERAVWSARGVHAIDDRLRIA
jgi:osmotically-inducible protein OsmY